jgi:hypothetical protein
MADYYARQLASPSIHQSRFRAEEAGERPTVIVIAIPETTSPEAWRQSVIDALESVRPYSSSLKNGTAQQSQKQER